MSKFDTCKENDVDNDILRSIESGDELDATWMSPAALAACLSRAARVIHECHPGQSAAERAFIEKCLARFRNATELTHVLCELDESARHLILRISTSTYALDRRVLANLLEHQELLDALDPPDLWLDDALFIRGSFVMRRLASRQPRLLSIEDIVPCRLTDWRSARPVLGAAFDEAMLTQESIERLRTLYPRDQQFAPK